MSMIDRQIPFALAAFASLQSNWTPMTVKALWQLPADRVGDIVLPPGHAPIVKVQFGSPGPPVASLDFLFFYTAATPIDADFCGQEMIEAHVTPIPNNPDAILDKPPALIAAPDRVARYRLRSASEGCDGARTFFSIERMTKDDAFAVLRMVRAAAAAAVKAGPRRTLPFAARCRDFVPSCAAADMLSQADLGSVLTLSSVVPMRDNSRVAKKAAARGWQYVSIEIGEVGGGDRESVELAYSRGRIMFLSIERDMIVY